MHANWYHSSVIKNSGKWLEYLKWFLNPSKYTARTKGGFLHCKSLKFI